MKNNDNNYKIFVGNDAYTMDETGNLKKGGYQKEHICKNIDDTYHQSCIYRYWTVHNTVKSDTVNNDSISWHRSISTNYKGMIKIYPLVYERVYFFIKF